MKATFKIDSWWPKKEDGIWFWAFDLIPAVTFQRQIGDGKYFQITISFLFWQISYGNM